MVLKPTQKEKVKNIARICLNSDTIEISNTVWFSKNNKIYTQYKTNFDKLYKCTQIPNTPTIPYILQMITINGIKIKYIVWINYIFNTCHINKIKILHNMPYVLNGKKFVPRKSLFLKNVHKNT